MPSPPHRRWMKATAAPPRSGQLLHSRTRQGDYGHNLGPLCREIPCSGPREARYHGLRVMQGLAGLAWIGKRDLLAGGKRSK
jgi:hypothetical protein